MKALPTTLILALTARLVLGDGDGMDLGNRTFTVDYEQNEFLLDGNSFRYVSGSFHYFRALPEVWRDRLKTMRAAGINAIYTYIQWSMHNPKDGEYTFEGKADVGKFIEMAAEEGFYVILRAGPYIGAEIDNGGLPYWLFTKYPEIKPRTNDPNYTHEISVWFEIIMTRLQRFFYGNGGPIIMVQVENEYGSFDACDKDYLNWLRDEIEKYVQDKALLFTTDMPTDRISCGKIDGVFATVDFGPNKVDSLDDIWATLRTVQPNGPLVNSEFYSGWITHWEEERQVVDDELVADVLRKILDYGASVNIYVFFGGTNFGFTAGANTGGYGNYLPDVTSYDYDAVMDESGDPTNKYTLVYEVLKDYLTVPDLEVPEKSVKTGYGDVQLNPVGDILNPTCLEVLSTSQVQSKYTKSFEELDQFSGLVLYETSLPKFDIDPTMLTVNDLRDRALVYIDGMLIGTLSRQNGIKTIPLNAGIGQKLQLLVENQGRINLFVANDTKGIFGPITLQQSDGSQKELLDWTSTSIPLESEQITQFLDLYKSQGISSDQNGILLRGPVVFHGILTINDEPTDTYADTEGWGKGVLFVNGLNLGRYWPLVGPQITLYVPKDILREGENDIVLVEYQKTQSDKQIHFTDTARLNGL